MNSQEHIQLSDRVGAHNYHPLPIVVARAERCWVWDVEDNKYMDCLSGYSALNHGHLHPVIIDALIAQAKRLTLTSRAFHNDQMGPFLAELACMTGLPRVLPMNTGAEAVETAIKAARKWGYEHKKVVADRAEIIVCADNFHGRTVTIVSFSTDPQYRAGFGPLTPGFTAIPFGDAAAFERAITPSTVGFLVEPIQGEGGINVPPKGYLKEVREICDRHNVLLMADEIQTGLARTGKDFCYQHEGILPDLVMVGKALGGGVLPVSAVAGTEEALGVFKPGDHGSTFGGNPLSSAVGSAALEVIRDEKLSERAAELGEYFMAGLRAIPSPHVKEVRGMGMLIGVELHKESGVALDACHHMMDLGILCKDTDAQVIRFAPALVIEKEEIDWALERIEKVLTRASLKE